MSSLKSYQLLLAGLPTGRSQRHYKVDGAFFEAMEQPEVSGADVDLSVDIEVKNEVVYLSFQANGELQIACDRCLEPMNLPVSVQESLVVKSGAEYDDSTDGVLTLPEEQTMLDLAPLVCDYLLLAIPMRHVHAPGECNPDMARILSEHTTQAPLDEPSEDNYD